MWNPRWWARNGCDGRLMAKILITTIQVNLCCLLHVSLELGTILIWIFIIKIFVISLQSQPFLGHHLGFHIFFHNSFLGGCTFVQLGCFWLDFIFVNAYCEAGDKLLLLNVVICLLYIGSSMECFFIYVHAIIFLCLKFMRIFLMLMYANMLSSQLLCWMTYHLLKLNALLGWLFY